MKISINSIRNMNDRYGSATDVAAIGVDALVDKIGAQLGAVEETINIGAKYQGIIIAKVVKCEDHPNADRLHVCTIDDGGVAVNVERDENGHVQVVCGAPNVRAGLIVAWLPPGSTVPESVGNEPFVLEARELRGVVSNGMLASPKELSLGDSHDGILEIDGEFAPGTDFAEAYGLSGDVVLDIENKMFTHRPDCFGFIGVARELAGIQGLPYKSPEWYQPSPEFPAPVADQLPLTIDNQVPELVPRFTAITMRDVQVGPSPVWLQVELAKVGSRSINNIVDFTNYYMLETSQPLHAYDYDKVKALSNGDAANIVVRHPETGETISLLNGKTIEPRAEAIMIASDKALIGVGGVMGGADTEVDANTKNIILEAANFDMYSIRRTAMAHGLFTDAVTRFNKGQSPLQNLAVLAKITGDIQKFAAGQVASQLVDDNHLDDAVLARNSLHAPVAVTADFINARLGLDLPADAMKTLLENVEFKIEADGDQLTVTAPFWRTDIELREDVVEEVGRLYGFDHLPLELPRRTITPTQKDPLLTLKTQIRESLSKAGANEVLTYSFVHGKLLENAGQNPKDAFKVSNALSPELQYYRLSLTPSLLEKIHPNIKAGYDQFAIFEMGKGHNLMHADDDEGLPSEFEMLDVIVTANDKTKPVGAAFYQARTYLEALAADFGLELVFEPLTEEQPYPVAQPYDYTRSAKVSVKGGQPLGMIGEYKANVRRNFKLPKYTAGFGVSLVGLLAASQQAPNAYRPLPRFPKVTQDITLKVPADISYMALQDFVEAELAKLGPDNTSFNISPIGIYQKAEDQDYK
ncbi:MAG: Phenylalanine-tRNA ligase beta subunit, partial [Candidatus Saccharibacteria bacterium]|nr:Phenylalanine-tRNA ligase beta subunit [Candidatus Saccharibacteria bacterium]